MGLLEEVTEAQRGKSRGPTCSAGRVVAEMGGEGDELEDLLEKRGRGEISVEYTTIAEVLKGRGRDVDYQILSRHARKLCGCFR